MVRLIVVIFAVLSTYGYVNAGVDWLTIGHGLNPWLAFPLAAVCMVIGFTQLIKYFEWCTERKKQQEEEAQVLLRTRKYQGNAI